MASSRKSLFTILGVLGAIAVLAVLYMWSGYNGLVTGKEGVDASWSQVEETYQRRMDLVPNLVSTVKGASNFEQQTLTQVTEARTKWLNASNTEDRVAAANEAESAIARLLVSVEAYPQLQATQAFRDLMAQLEGTENRISIARRDYNNVARDYNVMVKRFPKNVLAGMFGFEPATFFESDDGAENAPTVDFGTNSNTPQ